MAYGDEIKQGNIVENWLFDFANDNSGFLRFAFSDTTDSSNFYHGVILNKPSIRESIDLANSTAKSSNLSISIPDFTYQGSPISKELFGGSNHYINQTVSVWSKVGAGTKQQIGSFRLTDISSNGDTLQLSLTSHRPWDFISFPQTKTDVSGKYFPVCYGEFTESTSSPSSQNLSDGRALYPVPVDNVSGQILAITPRSYDGTTYQDGRLHHYEKDSDQFVPIDDSGFTDSTESYQGGNAIRCKIDLNRGFKTKPKTSLSGGQFTNPDNSFDSRTDESSTSASSTITLLSPGTTITRDFEMTAPNIIGKISEIKVFVRYKFQLSETVDTTGRLKLIFGGSTTTITSSSSASVQTWTSSDLITQYTNNDNQIPNVKIRAEGETDVPTETITTNIYDVQLLIKVALDQSNDPEGSKNYLDGLDLMYIGANGLSESWSGSNGEINEIHEAHRDLIIRYAGVTTTDPDGWTSLNSDKDWKIRWWQLEPTELKKALEQLQYEGGFIFRFKADGSPQYIHIPDTQTVSNTFTKQDISNVTVRPSPFSELLTKMDVNYEKHPAENRHLTSISSSNSTSRTNWNIQTKENIQSVNLDAYVSPTIPATPASNPNDDFYTYYDNIFGDIKMLVSCTIVNPKYYDVEVGDIVAFSDMYPETPFGYNSASWSGLKFMITSLNRTLGELKIEVREI